jgi:hypothetical protein
MLDGTYLFYCDRGWNCLDDTHHQDLAADEAHALFDGPDRGRALVRRDDALVQP